MQTNIVAFQPKPQTNPAPWLFTKDDRARLNALAKERIRTGEWSHVEYEDYDAGPEWTEGNVRGNESFSAYTHAGQVYASVIYARWEDGSFYTRGTNDGAESRFARTLKDLLEGRFISPPE